MVCFELQFQPVVSVLAYLLDHMEVVRSLVVFVRGYSSC